MSRKKAIAQSILEVLNNMAASEKEINAFLSEFITPKGIRLIVCQSNCST